MKLLLSVIDDLYRFAIESVLRIIGSGPERTPTLFSYVDTVPAAVRTDGDLRAGIPDQRIEPAGTFRTVQEVLSVKKADIPDVIPLGPAQNTVMYAQQPLVPVFENPTSEFDTTIGTIPYGSLVMALEEKGKFVRVSSNGHTGWVKKEQLADRAAYVYPDFTIGEKNDVDDTNTIRVRAMLQDEFSGSLVEYPLQAGEYVLYRLMRKGLRIVWPVTRPRVPGTWHTILKGVPGIHMGISPKTGSVMEYMLTDEIGHVAYVEAVFPDETITISEVNFPHSGIYNERVLTRDEWRELRPVFIQVS